MAILGINQVQVQNKKDAWDKVAQGIEIANGILGTALAIPKYMSDRKTNNLIQAEKKTEIAQNTELAQPGEQGSFEVPGMGLRKAVPDLQKQIQQATLQEKQSDNQIPSDSEYSDLLTMSPSSSLESLKKTYPTRGLLRDAKNRVFGATIVKTEDPFARERFNYQKGKDQKTFTNQEEIKTARMNQDKQSRRAVLPPEITGQKNQIEVYAPNSIVAQKIRDGVETSLNANNTISQMIALREKYGAETFNREAVAMGKQFSADLKLAFKQAAQLGVISNSDVENFLNPLVPKDPLEFKTSKYYGGGDPVMGNLKNLQKMFKDKLNAKLKSLDLAHDYIPSDSVYQSPPTTQEEVDNW